MCSSDSSVLVDPNSVFAEACSPRSTANRTARITVRTKYYIAIRSGRELRKRERWQLVSVSIKSGYFGTVIHLNTGLTRRRQSEADAARRSTTRGEPATYPQINSLLVRTKWCYRANRPYDSKY